MMTTMAIAVFADDGQLSAEAQNYLREQFWSIEKFPEHHQDNVTSIALIDGWEENPAARSLANQFLEEGPERVSWYLYRDDDDGGEDGDRLLEVSYAYVESLLENLELGNVKLDDEESKFGGYSSADEYFNSIEDLTEWSGPGLRELFGPYSAETAGVNDLSRGETPGRKETSPEAFDLIPVTPLLELARVYNYGAKKYEPNNWKKGYSWSKSYAALQRHLNAFWDGESVDQESSYHHLAHAAFHVFALLHWDWHFDEFEEFDDRPPVTRLNVEDYVSWKLS